MVVTTGTASTGVACTLGENSKSAPIRSAASEAPPKRQRRRYFKIAVAAGLMLGDLPKANLDSSAIPDAVNGRIVGPSLSLRSSWNSLSRFIAQAYVP